MQRPQRPQRPKRNATPETQRPQRPYGDCALPKWVAQAKIILFIYSKLIFYRPVLLRNDDV
jgi:hypothetical protein